MNISFPKSDIYWGYLSQFLQYGAALLILPLLLVTLSSEELGIWYIFMTISALVNMLDMGLTPTVSRNVSYVLGGAKILLKTGHEVIEKQSLQVDYRLLKGIIITSRRIFMGVAVIALIILTFPGSMYIKFVSRASLDEANILISWGVFVIAVVLNLFYKYYTPLLQGRGLFAGYYKSNAMSNIGFVLISGVLLKLHYGLLSVSIGFLCSAIIGRFLSWYYFYDPSIKDKLNQVDLRDFQYSELFGIMWHNAWRLGLGVIGAFLILKANTLFASIYLGLDTTAIYALTLQVFSVIQSISLVFFTIQTPKLAVFRVNDERLAYMNLMQFSFVTAWLMFIFGMIFVWIFGDFLVQLIGAKTGLLPFYLLVWVGVMMLLELNHSLAAGVIVTGNQVPFVKPALISGVVIVILSWAGLELGHYGVWWLIFTQFIVQLAYNNWQWPWRVYCEFYRTKPVYR